MFFAAGQHSTFAVINKSQQLYPLNDSRWGYGCWPRTMKSFRTFIRTACFSTNAKCTNEPLVTLVINCTLFTTLKFEKQEKKKQKKKKNWGSITMSFCSPYPLSTDLAICKQLLERSWKEHFFFFVQNYQNTAVCGPTDIMVTSW